MNLTLYHSRWVKAGLVCGALLCLLPLSSIDAKWHFRGGAVFDAKRFADNVKNYEQKVQEALAAVEKYENMLIMKTGVVGLSDRVNSAIYRYSDTYLGTSFTNPATDTSKVASAPEKLTEVDTTKELNEFKKSLHAEAVTVNSDTLKSYQQNLRNLANKVNTIGEIVEERTGNSKGGSELGEIQKTAAIAAMDASSDIDVAKNEAVTLMNTVENQNIDLAEERAEKARGSIVKVPTYDPYNMTDEEKTAFEKVSKDIGFGSFTGE